jgi:hypothetical protein
MTFLLWFVEAVRKYYGNPPMPHAVQDRRMRIFYWTSAGCLVVLALLWFLSWV